MLFDLNDQTAIEVITTYIQSSRQKGKTVGLTSGTFDLIHYHHVHYFTRCRRECDILIVGVDSDRLVKETKGEGRPLIYDARRAAMVDAQKAVTFTCVIDSLKDIHRISEITRPDIIFRNDDFKNRENEVIGKEFAGKIIIVPDVIDHTSTTQIISMVVKNLNNQKT